MFSGGIAAEAVVHNKLRASLTSLGILFGVASVIAMLAIGNGAEQEILYCVVTRLEIGKVRTIVRNLDAGAFIVFHPLAGAEGGVVKTRGFH